MVIEHRKVHDIIMQAKKAEPLSEKEYMYITPTREELLGMRYNREEAVVDKVSGKEGKVIGGIKEAVITG